MLSSLIYQIKERYIPAHVNYVPNESIMLHPNPQVLIDKFAGKGIKLNKLSPASSGFEEVFEF